MTCAIRSQNLAVASLQEIDLAIASAKQHNLSALQQHHWILCIFLSWPTKAPCQHIVQLAKAQVEANPSSRACRAVKDFSSISQRHAEQGCHVIFRKYGYSAKVEVKAVDLGPNNLKAFPYVLTSSWVQLLLDTDRLPRQLCGVANWNQMERTLEEFWTRYRALHPHHQIFSSGLDMQHVVPVFSHTDEGRSYKHQPLWVLSTHGCLGRGTAIYVRKKKHHVPLKRRSMGLNFLGRTWSTQYMFCTMLRAVETENPGTMQKLLSLYAEDMAMLATTGVKSSDGQKHIWLLHVATKGDLPALAKLGGFKRTHSHVPRGPSSKKACNGICHMCLAGKEAARPGDSSYPFEDTALDPAWAASFEVQVPWNEEPAILAGLPMNPGHRASFFCTDLWHNFHLGLSKHFFASSIVSAIERLDGLPNHPLSVEARLEWFTADFKEYCRAKRITPHLSEISRESLSWPSSKVCPVGRWSKGSVATNFMGYLQYFCERFVVGKTDDPIMVNVAPCSWIQISFFCMAPCLY